MEVEVLDGDRGPRGGYRVDVSRGGHDGRVSSEWFSRPDDEKFLSLSDLYASVKGRAERSRTRTVESAAIRVEAHRGRSRAAGARPAGFGGTGRADALVLRAALEPGWRAIGLIGSPMRAAPALTRFADSSPAPFVDGIRAASEEDRGTQGTRIASTSCVSAGFGKAGDGEDRRDGPRRGGAPARERLRLRAGHHRGRTGQAASRTHASRWRPAPRRCWSARA